MTAPQTLVLMYHAVLKQNNPAMPAGAAAYAVSAESFISQMDLLSQGWQAIKPVKHPQTESINSAQKPFFALTFDDTWQEHYQVTAPILAERKQPACFFITTGHIGEPGQMGKAEVRKISEMGFDIGSHGITHDFLSTLDTPTLHKELGDSKKRLEDITGKEVDTLSLPGGRGDERVFAMARESGYRLVFTSQPGFWDKADFCVNRIAITANTGIDFFHRLIKNPQEQIAPMAKKERRIKFLRSLTGEKLYHKIYDIISSLKQSGPENET